MENYYEIKRQANITYFKLFVLSLLIGIPIFFYEKDILLYYEKSTHLFGYMILCSILASVLLYVVGCILLMMVCKLFNSTSGLAIIVLEVLGYIGFTIYEIKKQICPSNVWMIILGVLITLILFIVGLVIAVMVYMNVCTIQELCIKSKMLAEGLSSYQTDVDFYNEKADDYNETNYRIHQVGRKVSEKYKYKIVNRVKGNMNIPQYYSGNIHMFNCVGTSQYYREIGKYQKKIRKTQNKMNEQGTYIDSVVDKKKGLLEQVERNAKRIKNPSNTEKLNEIFRDSTLPAFRSLKQKKLHEEKIKSIERR